MGFNFRKIINLGKGFKASIGKSGAGFSWGTKGFRISRSAKGDVRTTYSIPGTGISYSKNIATKKGKFKTLPIIIAIVVIAAVLVISNKDSIIATLENIGLKSNTNTQESTPAVNETTSGKSDESFVFVSASGKKYHLESCRTLKDNKNKLSLDKAISEGYEPCQICKPPVK